MGKKRKKGRAAKEPRKNHHLHPHSCSRPSISTREHKRRDPAPGTGSGSGSESDPSLPSTSDAVRRLIDPYSKPRLIAILAEAATANPALRARLGAAAAASPSHRQLFVHGLPPHADSAALAEAFSRFGPLADCHAIADHRASGRCCKGYGFVSFASRAAARHAVREAPRVTVAGRPVSVQFASAGPDPSGGGGAGAAGRRVYVTNVAPDASAERLRAFFARFGELEGGPFGFDGDTGYARFGELEGGYALFVYQAAAGAAKAVQEPYRVFEGRTLHCQLANEPAAARKTKAPVAPPPAVVAASAAGTPPRLQSVLDAAAAAGVVDLASYARDPAQAAALLGQNPALAAAALSTALASGDATTIPLTPAAVSVPMEVALASPKPATAVTVAPSPVMVGVRPSGGPGLLGAYKPPSLLMVSSSSGRKGILMGT